MAVFARRTKKRAVAREVEAIIAFEEIRPYLTIAK